MCGNELGTLKMTTDFVREWIICTYASHDDVLLDLSQRYVDAAKELALPHLPLIFAIKHGRVSSDHFRTLAHVFEVIICDFPEAEEVRLAVHNVIAWYWASREGAFTDVSIDALADLGRTMLASLSFFESADMRGKYRAEASVPKGALATVPKVHRATKHVPGYIGRFGPYEDLTTEPSETANKPLKQMFKTNVLASLPAVGLLCACVRACVRMRVYVCVRI